MDQVPNRESRRKFLKTAGKFAVYTPPALMIMSKSSHASFTKSGGGYSGGNEGGSEGNNNHQCGGGMLGKLYCILFS